MRPEVIQRHVVILEASHVRAFINDKAFPKSNDGLKVYITQHPDPELNRALAWSEALNREWAEHDIDKYVRAIAGQEKGTKTQHLAFAADGTYQPNHMLMIGDALGDMKAARANHALFFPINPGHEDASWQRFFEGGFHKFLNETFEGDYEASLIAEFEKFMPETPPWEK